MKKTLVFLIILFGAATAMIAQAHNHKSGKFIEKMTEKLELSSAQQTQFQAFINEKRQYKQERTAERESRKSNPDQKRSGPLSELADKSVITVNDINQAMTSAHQRKLKRQEKVFSSFVVFYNDLSSQQQEKLKPYMHKMLLSKKKRKDKNKDKSKDKSNR